MRAAAGARIGCRRPTRSFGSEGTHHHRRFSHGRMGTRNIPQGLEPPSGSGVVLLHGVASAKDKRHSVEREDGRLGLVGHGNEFIRGQGSGVVVRHPNWRQSSRAPRLYSYAYAESSRRPRWDAHRQRSRWYSSEPVGRGSFVARPVPTRRRWSG